ncbi:hypothetical protein DID80_06295 [Candidatus Marinamargulisbacteria bacterium SCGC AAA071-K20]|nr:hypothetical protein DID80_06295 [Candidatus Marinamargulisbacteria bacterium SCGC AAA071-K20]
MCFKIRFLKSILFILVFAPSSTINANDNPFDLSNLEADIQDVQNQEYITHYLNYTNTKDLETIINTIDPNHFLIFDHPNNRVLIPQNQDKDFFVQTIKGLDTRPKQLSLEIKVVEINYADFEQYQSLFSKIGEGFYISYDMINNKTIPSKLINSTLINLEQNGDAKILAKPKIMSKNNNKTILNIGEKHPYIVFNNHNNSVVKTVKYVESGIKLNFTPRITNDNYIDLKIKVDIIHIKYLKEVDSNQLPVLSHREIESKVVIKNKHTIALAGMFEEKTNLNKGGFPILKAIPIIGHLFKYKISAKEHSDIMIFITPKIL